MKAVVTLAKTLQGDIRCMKVCSYEAQALLPQTFILLFLAFVVWASINMGAGRLMFHASGYTWCLVYMRQYCWQWKRKAGFSPQGGHNLLREALVQVSNYNKMCVKKFCGKYTGILEEEITNIVSIVHKKGK